MPVNLSTNKIKFKNENGNYVTVDVITDDTTESRIAALEAVKSSAISAINEAENDALVNIEDTYAAIPEFKNDLSFNEYFINDGKYTIKLSDLEQGQWSYGVKDDSSNKLATRVRNKYLIPVHAGMVVSYSNPTFDIYFGILQPRTANNSYIQNSGWKSASASVGIFEILQDGWMTFIMRNPNDINFSVNLNLADYDCEITIYTASYMDKDILAFDNFLISNGKYTIQASDLEFGQWSFSIKKQVLNSSGKNIRARMKYLIPVHKGMKIAYCNPTFDTYFGVLETPTKFSYIQDIGWKTNRYGFINITQNGYMTFIIRNHNDINSEIDLANYDSIITIYTEANNSIEQLESDTSIYENLTNNGQYVIKASDLEVGSWSYSSKDINSARARMKQLIPVYAGMKITYSNTTFDTYFGILDTPTSISYKQYSGWITDGNGTYNITSDGWMTFIIRNHEDISADVDPSDFDSEVVIYINNYIDSNQIINKMGIFEDTIKVLKNVNKIENRIYLNWEQGGYYGSNSESHSIGDPYINSVTIRTPKMALAPGNYIVTIEKGLNALLLFYEDGEYHLFGNSIIENKVNTFLFITKENSHYALMVKKNSEEALPISPSDGAGVTLHEYIPKLSVNEETGIVDVNWHRIIGITDTGMINLSQTTSASDILPIPKDGMNIYVDHEVSDEVKYNVYFMKKDTNGAFIPDQDYAYSMTDWSGIQPTSTATKIGAYFPYSEGTYFTIISRIAPVTICTGTKNHNYGRLTNLAPVSFKYTSVIVNGETKYKIDPVFKAHGADGEYSTAQIMYGSVIRIRDAQYVCCNPMYTLSAWIYDGNLENEQDYIEDTNTHERYFQYNKFNHRIDCIYGKAFSPRFAYTGQTYIDLSKYDKNGYAIIVIHDKHTVYPSTEITSRAEETHGIFRSYDDVLDNVFVGYYNHVVIEHAKSSNSIFFENLRTLKETTFPNTFAMHWRGPYNSEPYPFAAMKNPTLGFYTGKYTANVPLQNVSCKSIATANQNPCSVVYCAEWKSMDKNEIYDGVNSTSYTHNAYGGICSNLPTIITGLNWFAHGENYYYKIPDGWNGFKIMHDFDVITRADELQPGDWLFGASSPDLSDYHVITVTDIISINGEITCIETIDAYPPIWRYRTGWLTAPYSHINLEFSSTEPLDTFFNLVVRPPKSIYRRMKDIWDMNTNYSVGTLMCDRGTDSVYCAGNRYLYITIADSNITEIKVFKNDQEVNSIVLEERDKIKLSYISDLDSIDIIEDIRASGPGYYTLKPVYGNIVGTVQESFYVANVVKLTQTKITRNTDNCDVVEITFPNPENITCICAWYVPPATYSNNNYVNLTQEEINYNSATGTWDINIIPFDQNSVGEGISPLNARILHLPNEIKNGKLTVSTAATKGERYYLYKVVEATYKTDYGTFVARCDFNSKWCSSDNNYTVEVSNMN